MRLPKLCSSITDNEFKRELQATEDSENEKRTRNKEYRYQTSSKLIVVTVKPFCPSLLASSAAVSGRQKRDDTNLAISFVFVDDVVESEAEQTERVEGNGKCCG